MNKSTTIVKSTISLAEMTTWQSGILQSAVHRQTKKLTDGYLKDYGLSNMHWLIIGAIYETGDTGIRLTDLAEKLGTTASYLTNAINNLELRGMVSRVGSSTDSRSKLLTVPGDYRDSCEEIEAGLRDIFRNSLYSKMTRAQLENYITVLQILADLK